MSIGEAIYFLLALIIPGSFIAAIIECEAEQRKREKEREEARKWQLR